MSNFRKVILNLLVIQKTFKIIEKYFEACQTFQDLSNFREVTLDLLFVQESFRNHRKIFGSLQDIPGLLKLQESYLGHSGNPGDFEKSKKNIWKLARHSRTSKTSGKFSWTFWQPRRHLKIIQKYFEGCKTFKDL